MTRKNREKALSQDFTKSTAGADNTVPAVLS